MPRPRSRLCLEQGLKLDINRLLEIGVLSAGSRSCAGVQWPYSYFYEGSPEAKITSNLEGTYEGWMRIEMNGLDQTIFLVPRPRHFGGYQWYFVCPVMNLHASNVWMPLGATRFCSRQAWGRRAAYASQFLDKDNRAHRGKSKIKNRLIANLDPDDWDLPPKPKWMRWRTYNRYVERFDRYEAILDDGMEDLVRLAIKLKIL